jgi:hypothetical protein
VDFLAPGATNLIPRTVPPGLMRPGPQSDHTFSSDAEVKNDGDLPPHPQTPS